MRFKLGDRVKFKKNNKYRYGYIKKVLEITKTYIVIFNNDTTEYYIKEIDLEYDYILEVENKELKEKIEKLTKVIQDQDIIINDLITQLNKKPKSIFNFFKRDKED